MRTVLALASAVGVQIAFAVAITPLGNRGISRESTPILQMPDPRQDAGLVIYDPVALALALAAVVLLAVVVVRTGGRPWTAAALAALMPPLAVGGAATLEELLYPDAYFFFLPIAGWSVFYGWPLLLLFGTPFLSGIAALLAFATAFVARRLARAGG